MVLMFYGEVENSCSLWRLWPSLLWKDLSEGAEEIAIGGRFHSLIQRLHRPTGEGVNKDRILGLFLV